MNVQVTCRLARFQRSQQVLRSSNRSRTKAQRVGGLHRLRARDYSVEASTAPASASGGLAQPFAVPTQRTTETRTPKQALPSPLTEYERRINAGVIRKDDFQEEIVGRLQKLHDELTKYAQPPIFEDNQPSSSSIFSRIFSKQESEIPEHPPADVPRGLYLHGDVGTGKTMLMDMFYDTLPTNIKRKRRVHFHAFMIDVHKRVHAVKMAMGLSGGDPIVPVATELAREATVLCFDEFQVTDIVDAMILRRLLESLHNYGVVFVMTSNRPPDELYKNGIQRSSFIPCIELLKTKFDVINLDSDTDYRRIPRALSNVYYHPLSQENVEEVNKIFAAIAARDGEPISHNRHLKIWGRTLHIPESTSHVAKFNFDQLCGHPLSAADYIEVTKTFHTIFLTDVPKMDLGQKDKARRFITFIDACYENKIKLFVSSEVPIYQVFSNEEKTKKGISDHQRSVMDDLGLSESTIGATSMFTGEEEIFAFARCCSRLVQMGSKEWANTAGRD